MDKDAREIGVNLDECVFCALCEEICPNKAIRITNRFELAEKDRMKLRKSALVIEERKPAGQVLRGDRR